jgi:two-component system sensor histidine kinase RegB
MFDPTQVLTTAQNLRRLVLLRYFVLAVLVAAAVFAVRTLHLAVPFQPVAAAVGFLALLNVGSHLRLRLSWPVTGAEMLVNLGTEVIALTVLLYYTGGSTNPLVSLYLLSLIVAAAVLPRAHTWAVATLAVACYTVLMFRFEPLKSFHDHEHGPVPAGARPPPRGCPGRGHAQRAHRRAGHARGRCRP